MGGQTLVRQTAQEHYNEVFVSALKGLYLNNVRLQTEDIPRWLLSWLYLQCEKELGYE